MAVGMFAFAARSIEPSTVALSVDSLKLLLPGTCVRNAIRTLRFRNGEMTQQQLADSVGLARQTIIAIEQSRYSPSLEAAFKIARAFRVPLEQVFRYEHQPSHGQSKPVRPMSQSRNS
jgi:putative transcriptional regulator